MTSEIYRLAEAVLSATKKGWFRRKPIFEPYAKTSSEELRKLEEKIDAVLPEEFRNWLLAVGYGDINEELSFRKEWCAKIEDGQLKGSARFAQDDLGNFYAFDAGGRIFFLARFEPVFAEMAKDFLAFIEELVRRDYKLADWVNTLATQKYVW